MHDLLGVLGLGLLVLANAVCVMLVLLQLPGGWLMVVFTGMASWVSPQTISPWTIVFLVVLAMLGEFLEFVGSAGGCRKAGGSLRASFLGMIGAVAGAIIATFAIPVPVVGTIAGACMGAGFGSYLGDQWAGHGHEQSVVAATGAAAGRLYGTGLKSVVVAAMWLIATVAVFVA